MLRGGMEQGGAPLKRNGTKPFKLVCILLSNFSSIILSLFTYTGVKAFNVSKR